MKKLKIERISKEDIIKMMKECEIPESKNGISITWKDTDDEYYEDENYICWNGACVKKE